MWKTGAFSPENVTNSVNVVLLLSLGWSLKSKNGHIIQCNSATFYTTLFSCGDEPLRPQELYAIFQGLSTGDQGALRTDYTITTNHQVGQTGPYTLYVEMAVNKLLGASDGDLIGEYCVGMCLWYFKYI